MIKEEILQEVRDIFRKTFKNDALTVDLNTSMDDIHEWDSLMHVVLIDTIEKHYNIKLDLHDLLSIEKVDDICRIVIKNLPANGNQTN
jgi:acyl carrier protein